MPITPLHGHDRAYRVEARQMHGEPTWVQPLSHDAVHQGTRATAVHRCGVIILVSLIINEAPAVFHPLDAAQ